MHIRPVISKLFYAVLLSSLAPDQPPSAQPQSSLHPARSRFNRAISIVHLVDRVIPGTAERLSRRIYLKSRFPWVPVDTELIARGSGAAVFKVNWGNGEKVLRIYRRSLGNTVDGLLRVATYYRGRFQTVRSWYGDAEGLVVPTDFLVLQGPPLVGPVAASLQTYIRGQKQDPFLDLSEEELLALLMGSPYLREQFLFFARQTLQQWDEGEMCFDLLGRQNLMLVNEGASYHFCIVDTGIFRFDLVKQKYPAKLVEIEKRMQCLDRLYKLAKVL